MESRGVEFDGRLAGRRGGVRDLRVRWIAIVNLEKHVQVTLREANQRRNSV